MSLQEIDRKKVRATRMPGTAVVRHIGVIWRWTCGAMPFGYCALRGCQVCSCFRSP
jgi:hypothetical protein